MEKGEMGILAVQFGALIVAVLLLSNFASGGINASSTPSISRIYWGAPPPGNGTSLGGGSHTVPNNASSVAVFYTLEVGAHLVSETATRLCSNPNSTASIAGRAETFTNFTTMYDSSKKADYFVFHEAGQPNGWACIYSITITDSLQQSTNFVTTVTVKPPASG